MTRNRGNERGVVKLASNAFLTGLLSLLGVAACSTDADTGFGGGEHVGSVHQAISCSKVLLCPPGDDCFDYQCQALVCVAVPKGDGLACKNAQGLVGACVGTMCCLGCMKPDASGQGWVCGAGDTLTECGMPGDRCDICDKGNTCELYACNEKRLCETTPVADKEPCTDNSGVCWGGSCCSGCLDANDTCVAGNAVMACGHSSPASGLVGCKNCDDGNVCSNDPCTNGVCAAKTPKAGACNDNDACTSSDTCSGTTCGGTQVACNDGKICTIDTCDPMTGCKYTPQEAGQSCDDANVCNGVSFCDGGTTCKPGTPPDCDDGNPCTTDSCDTDTGCKNVNNTLPCSDNNLCTIGDQCGAGSCKPGTGSPVLDDNNPCTTDTCSPATGPVHTSLPNGDPCDDGNACTTTDECVAGKCLGSGGPSCDDSNPCTKNTCSVANQACSNPNEANDTPCVFDKCHVNSTCQAGNCTAGTLLTCDDSNPCTDDSCDGATGCKHVNNTADCSDDDQCTQSDKCAGGECVGVAKVCKAIDACHEAGECDPADGNCDDPRAPDGTDCKSPLGEDSQCDSGLCPEPAVGGAGGGGETGAGGAGPGAGGSPVVGEGGDTTVGPGGAGNEPGTAGTPGEPAGGAPGGPSGGSSTNNEAGVGEDVEHHFVRDPGGCSCGVPGSENRNGGAVLLAGLALAAGLARRGRARRRAA